MANIKLQNRNGAYSEFNGVTQIVLPTVEGETATFSLGSGGSGGVEMLHAVTKVQTRTFTEDNPGVYTDAENFNGITASVLVPPGYNVTGAVAIGCFTSLIKNPSGNGNVAHYTHFVPTQTVTAEGTVVSVTVDEYFYAGLLILNNVPTAGKIEYTLDIYAAY